MNCEGFNLDYCNSTTSWLISYVQANGMETEDLLGEITRLQQLIEEEERKRVGYKVREVDCSR